MKGATAKPMNEHLKQISSLAAKLCEKLDCAIDAIDAGELIADRQALRNITGALKDLRDLCDERAAHSASAADPASTLTVAFLGDAKVMAE